MTTVAAIGLGYVGFLRADAIVVVVHTVILITMTSK